MRAFLFCKNAIDNAAASAPVHNRAVADPNNPFWGEAMGRFTHLLLTAWIVYSAVAVATIGAYAQVPMPAGIDTLNSKPRILHIGRINTDCLPDTLIGVMDSRFHHIPVVIHWGRSDSLPASQCPNGLFLDSVEQLRQVPITLLHYPEWEKLTASVSATMLNNDLYEDLIITVRGKVDTGIHRRDTMRILVIFGQLGLDTLQTLRLDSLAPMQSTPFFAMELLFGTHLIEPGYREIGSSVSHTLTPITVQVVPDSTPPPPPIIPPPLLVDIRILPNPTFGTAQVEASPLPEGEYVVQVISVNGTEVHRQNVTVGSSQDIQRTLRLQNVPSGWYIVRLYSNSQRVGEYPIVINR